MISHSWGVRYSVERPLVLKWPTDPAPWRTPVSCHRPANLECRVWHPKWYLPKVRFSPWKFNSKSPWKYTIPKRKVVFQPSFFTGRAVKLQECKTPLLQISQVWNLGNADSGIRYDSYFSYFVFGVSSCSRLCCLCAGVGVSIWFLHWKHDDFDGHVDMLQALPETLPVSWCKNLSWDKFYQITCTCEGIWWL